MVRRLLPLLALALLVPASAQASTETFGTQGRGIDSLSPQATLHKAGAALEKGRGVQAGTEITPLLKQLALKLPALHGAERKRALGLLARPTQGQGSSSELEYEGPEETPVCSDHFCIHWVEKTDKGGPTDDAPPLTDSNHNGVPDYVETMDSVFEHVYAVENVELGWRAPTSDGKRGCAANAPANCPNKTDVYIKEIGSQGIYGYSAPDPGQRSYSQAAYLVMDDDYNATQFPRYEGDPLQPMEVTAAHEYNHVLQFGYDTAQDTWMFESTAVWMEDRVYTDVNDYLQYLTPWAQMTFVPLTYFSSDGNDPLNVKVYGDGVWNRWIQTRFGEDVIRNAWASSRKTSPKSFAPEAYNRALSAKESSFYSAFSSFAADTAEWRASNTPFEEGVTFPDVDRAASDKTGRPITLTADGVGASGKLSHAAFVLLDVRPDSGVPQLRLAVNTPRGTRMAFAVVGRTGDEVNGQSHEFAKPLPNGGPGVITIENPGQYERLTAVVVNADTSQDGFSRQLQDWDWRKDGQAISARVSTDLLAPSVKRRAPIPGSHHTSTRTRVKVSFSERLFDLTSKSVRLVGPGGHSVKTKLGLSFKGRKTRTAAGADTVVLTPHTRLRNGKRYEVRLSRDLRDFGGNALPASALKWSFVTKR
jgi:hypothetical protein